MSATIVLFLLSFLFSIRSSIFDSGEDSNQLDLLSGAEIPVLNRFLEDFRGNSQESLKDEARELIKKISSNKYYSFSVPSISQGTYSIILCVAQRIQV